jgi:hypothetical protein
MITLTLVVVSFLLQLFSYFNLLFHREANST